MTQRCLVTDSQALGAAIGVVELLDEQRSKILGRAAYHGVTNPGQWNDVQKSPMLVAGKTYYVAVKAAKHNVGMYKFRVTVERLGP